MRTLRRPVHSALTRHLNMPPPETGTRESRDTSKVTCYNCNKQGHYSRDCKDPPKPRATRIAALAADFDAAEDPAERQALQDELAHEVEGMRYADNLAHARDDDGDFYRSNDTAYIAAFQGPSQDYEDASAVLSRG